MIMPIQIPYARRKDWAGCPRGVPWAVVKDHEAQAMANHSQTLTRLAERGGMSPSELWAIVNDRAWREAPLPQPELREWLNGLGS